MLVTTFITVVLHQRLNKWDKWINERLFWISLRKASTKQCAEMCSRKPSSPKPNCIFLVKLLLLGEHILSKRPRVNFVICDSYLELFYNLFLKKDYRIPYILENIPFFPKLKFWRIGISWIWYYFLKSLSLFYSSLEGKRVSAQGMVEIKREEQCFVFLFLSR